MKPTTRALTRFAGTRSRPVEGERLASRRGGQTRRMVGRAGLRSGQVVLGDLDVERPDHLGLDHLADPASAGELLVGPLAQMLVGGFRRLSVVVPLLFRAPESDLRQERLPLFGADVREA